MDNLHSFSHSIITTIQETNPFILIGLATLLYWLALSYYKSEARKLRQFPTVGSTSPLFALFGINNNTQNLVEFGRQKWPGRIFKVPEPTGWYVVISDPTLVDDIRKAPDHLLCPRKSAAESLQIQFTFSRQTVENPFHIGLVKTRLKRELPALVPDVYDELVAACKQYLPAKDEWYGIKAVETMATIVARAANRAFVGTTLCRNPEWIKLGLDFTISVVKTSSLLIRFPSFLRPFVDYFVNSTKVAQRNHAGLQLLGPVISARHHAKRQEGSESPNDFLSWLMEESKGERDDLDILERLYGLSFVAIHTTSVTGTQAMFDLAANPEYLKPLREEVEEVTKREGWTKAGLDQMHKLDSFVKESQRLHPVGILMMRRYALQNYTFSDGTTVPAGTFVAIPSGSVQLDPDVYEDPLRFDGFRFMKMKERAALDGDLDKKYDMVTVNSEFIAFGQGKHACPARFFASAEIKLLLAHIVMTYDVKLADGDVRPPDLTLMNSNRPNPEAKIYFRKRQ